MKLSLSTKENMVYNENSSLELAEEAEPFSGEEFIELEKITRTINGEIFVTINEENRILCPDQIYHENTVLDRNGFVYSNVKPINQANAKNILTEIWVKFDTHPHLHFADANKEANYLPLLVERGPPGCNMNYPICSILYPRSPLPFLANYPYSLTFKNLHSKYMKVSEVTIERIGCKKNVNEIKEGYVYFKNDANIHSKKYYFAFKSSEENTMVVNIDEDMYWKYMVI